MVATRRDGLRPQREWRLRATLVAGTRPELVKLNPVAHALVDAGWQVRLIHSGQHYSPVMAEAFLRGLEWPCPVTRIRLLSRRPMSAFAQMVRMLPRAIEEAPSVILVQGDTNSTLAGALVANRLALPVVHVEAGLRSRDLRMLEEHNRRIVDHIADVLCAPTEKDADNVRAEGVWGSIAVTGNTAIDAVRRYLQSSREPKLGTGHVLVTLHRAENVDDQQFLEKVLGTLVAMDIDVLFPIHPRTRLRLRGTALEKRLQSAKRLRMTSPLGYVQFLSAMAGARLILTDSGGVVEEATAPEIRRPVLIVRASTERLAAIDAGFALLSSAEPEAIRTALSDVSWFKPAALSPFGSGDAALKIVAHLANWSA